MDAMLATTSQATGASLITSSQTVDAPHDATSSQAVEPPHDGTSQPTAADPEPEVVAAVGAAVADCAAVGARSPSSVPAHGCEPTAEACVLAAHDPLPGDGTASDHGAAQPAAAPATPPSGAPDAAVPGEPLAQSNGEPAAAAVAAIPAPCDANPAAVADVTAVEAQGEVIDDAPASQVSVEPAAGGADDAALDEPPLKRARSEGGVPVASTSQPATPPCDAVPLADA